jgi:hypothetical protein
MAERPQMHRLSYLLTTAASFMSHLGSVTGLRVGLHTMLPEGVRLLAQTGRPYTDEVGPLDRVGVTLGASITHDRSKSMGHAFVRGNWGGTTVYASHLESDPPVDPCTQSASELSHRMRMLIPWGRQGWSRWAESVHVYDARGIPCVHVVLTSEECLDDALASLLHASGPLQYRYPREHDFVAHGSVLLEDGTVVTASAVTPA